MSVSREAGPRTRTRTDRKLRQLDFDDGAVNLTPVHVGSGFLRGRGIGILQGCFPSVLAGFSEDWEINLDYIAIKAKDCFEVGLNDVAAQVCDDNDAGGGLFCRRLLAIHVHVGVLVHGRPRRQ